MNSEKLTDAELGAALRAASSETVFSPNALLTFAKEAAEHYKRTAITSQSFSRKEGKFEYNAKLISEYPLEEQMSQFLPDWVNPFISAGYKIEKWEWNDGVVVLRLTNARGKMIAGITL